MARVRSLPGALIVLLLLALLGASPAVASDRAAWDPNDVPGPLDIRWIGAAFLAGERIKLTVSFYEDFDAGALVHTRRGLVDGFGSRHGVIVRMAEAVTGYFRVKENGRIRFVYGDFGSNCCYTARVLRPSRTILRVVFPIVPDPASCIYVVHATSTWHEDGGPPIRDRTDRLPLGRAPGECSQGSERSARLG